MFAKPKRLAAYLKCATDPLGAHNIIRRYLPRGNWLSFGSVNESDPASMSRFTGGGLNPPPVALQKLYIRGKDGVVGSVGGGMETEI